MNDYDADTQVAEIRNHYARRRREAKHRLYSLLDHYALMVDQEKDRAIVGWLRSSRIGESIETRKLLEIGCGGGGNLLRFMRMGFCPENLVGNELLPDRLKDARRILPPAIDLIEGDASTLELDPQTFDVVCLFTVLTSVLDREFQQRLADSAWSLAKPGGGVLWYDFVYDNSHNPDVRGISVRRLRELFPEADMSIKRLTLAPPIGRRVARWQPRLYSLFNAIPLFRTHVLAWLAKRGHRESFARTPKLKTHR